VLQYLHVGKKLGEKWLFADISLEVKAGELVWLEGTSGSGKSVLFDMALGFAAPTAGNVFVNGTSPARAGFHARQQLRRGISLVRDDEVDDRDPVATWLALGPWCAGQLWERSCGASREALEKASLTGAAGLPFCELSRGERAALSGARALARRPHLLLVDWPNFFGTSLPGWLADDLRKYLSEGGACLVAGGPEGKAAEWGGRSVQMELPGAGR